MPPLVVQLMASVLSSNTDMSLAGISLNSVKKLRIYAQSFAASNMATYSASQVNVETVLCSLDLQVMGIPVMSKTYPIVDFAVS